MYPHVTQLETVARLRAERRALRRERVAATVAAPVRPPVTSRRAAGAPAPCR